jgi:hypothetical protein
MFKLFVTAVLMSDTGSIATTSFVTDYDLLGPCRAQEAAFTKPDEIREMNGHRFTIHVRASCEPAGQVQYGQNIPPPVRGMIQGFLGGFGR